MDSSSVYPPFQVQHESMWTCTACGIDNQVEEALCVVHEDGRRFVQCKNCIQRALLWPSDEKHKTPCIVDKARVAAMFSDYIKEFPSRRGPFNGYIESCRDMFEHSPIVYRFLYSHFLNGVARQFRGTLNPRAARRRAVIFAMPELRQRLEEFLGDGSSEAPDFDLLKMAQTDPSLFETFMGLSAPYFIWLHEHRLPVPPAKFWHEQPSSDRGEQLEQIAK